MEDIKVKKMNFELAEDFLVKLRRKFEREIGQRIYIVILDRCIERIVRYWKIKYIGRHKGEEGEV